MARKSLRKSKRAMVSIGLEPGAKHAVSNQSLTAGGVVAVSTPTRPAALTRKPINLVATAKELSSLYAMKRQIQIAAIQR
jgi:hypothetical protein